MEWPPEFYAQVEGAACPMCEQGRPDETRHGVRFFAGVVADAYLVRADIQRGLSVVIWRGRHVVEPFELDLHTHLVPRYADDPRPGWPFPFPETDPPPIPDARLRELAAALRAAIR